MVVYRSNFKKVSLLKYLWIRLHPPTLSVCVCVRLALSLQSTNSTLIVSTNTFNNVKVNNVRSHLQKHKQKHTQTYTQQICINDCIAIYLSLESWQSHTLSVAVSNNKQLAMSMSSLHMKVLN